MLPRRHRRHRFQVGDEPRRMKVTPIIAVLTALSITYYLGSLVLQYFGVGNNVRSAAVELVVEDSGVVNVSLEGSQMKRADSGIKLYPADIVESTSGNYAILTFFDGSHVRLDENTRVRIVTSKHGEEESAFSIELDFGRIWIQSPTLAVYSGSIMRTVTVQTFSATIPAETEAVFSSDSVFVYSADGLGIALKIPDTEGEYFVGEGQQFVFTSTADRNVSLYTYRQPVAGDRLRSVFVNDSRKSLQNSASGTVTLDVLPSDEETLTVITPEENAQVSRSTVQVSGAYGVNVDKVRINGYQATLDPEKGIYTQEIALSDSDTMTITVEAVDTNGIVLEEIRRTITRDREAPPPPTITSPAANGTTYKTNLQQFELRGTVSEGTIGVIVNDYRLQLFNPEDTTWSYLASTRLENLKEGENIFNVYAIGSNTLKSEPATITIIIGEGDQGVVSSAPSTSGSAGSAGSTPTEPEQADETTLPQNAPLQPGSLTVEKPEPGTTHSTSEVEFLIEGSVPSNTGSVWVNGYKLRLYEAGKTFWNYIASVELGTMKRGQNTYKVNARDKEGNIIDSLTYVITFTP